MVYLVVIVILASTLLCVSTTMMAMVMERRREIGLSVFKAYITLRPSVLMAVIILSVLVAWVAVIMPVRTAANIEPALVLKGE